MAEGEACSSVKHEPRRGWNPHGAEFVNSSKVQIEVFGNLSALCAPSECWGCNLVSSIGLRPAECNVSRFQRLWRLHSLSPSPQRF